VDYCLLSTYCSGESRKHGGKVRFEAVRCLP
jgi:hypothetical protein